jgi:hypothetical protein
VVGERGKEDAEDDRRWPPETSGKNHGENLRFVADLGETDNRRRNQESVHGNAVGVGRELRFGTAPLPDPGCQEANAKGLANRVRLPAPRPKPSVLTQVPQKSAGGYSPMTRAVYQPATPI